MLRLLLLAAVVNVVVRSVVALAVEVAVTRVLASAPKGTRAAELLGGGVPRPAHARTPRLLGRHAALPHMCLVFSVPLLRTLVWVGSSERLAPCVCTTSLAVPATLPAALLLVTTRDSKAKANGCAVEMNVRALTVLTVVLGARGVDATLLTVVLGARGVVVTYASYMALRSNAGPMSWQPFPPSSVRPGQYAGSSSGNPTCWLYGGCPHWIEL